MGQIDKILPAGVIILENYNVNVDVIHENYFAFSIVFCNEPHKYHILSSRSESYIGNWINAIKQASYGYWRSQLILLQQILCEKTGMDPLLMYPRNKGVIRDEAWGFKPSFKSHIKSFALSSSTSTIEFDKSEENIIDLK
jgi:hypothetical protein